MFHSSQADGRQNYGSFHDPVADGLLERIRATADDAVRHGLDRQLHRRLHETQPYAFLGLPEAETLIAPRVHALAPSSEGFPFAAAWVDR
jgi:ABC-type transport system substrate-binding protein